MSVRRTTTLLFLCFLTLAPLAHATSDVVISQVYGGGGNSGATYKNDFIELYNRGTATVPLTGWSVQYASSAGTSWQVTTLSGSIGPGQYYLVQEAVGAGGTLNLPAPVNATGSISMSATAGKVALVAATAALSGGCPAGVIDFVGFGGANCFEGVAPTPTLANTTAALRNLSGCTDTDNNSADFSVGAPAPRNTATPPHVCDTPNQPPAITAPANPIATVAQGAAPFTVTLAGTDDGGVYNWSATPGSGVTSVTVTGGQGTANVTYTVALTPSFSGTATFTASLSDTVNPAVTRTVNIGVTPSIPNNPPAITPFANPVLTVAQDAVPFTVSLSGSDDNNVFTWSATAGSGVSSATVTAGQGTANATYTVALTPGFSGTATFTAALSDGVNPNVTAAVTITVTPAPPPPLDHIVISQIYGGGGNSGATYLNDYVELYNPTTAAVDLGGWTIQYASATGTSTWQAQPLGGTMQPGEYYLISLASGGATGAPLPSANITGSINMSGTAGKVALSSTGDPFFACAIGDDALVDLVGYGTTANCREGATNAPTASNTTALFRKNGGFTDTNVNGSDFQTGAPNPRRTTPIQEIGPAVLTTDPRANGTNAPRDASVTVTFTEAVEVNPGWFSITCVATGAHNDVTVGGGTSAWIITPNVNFQAGEQCTVTIFAAFVHDVDLDDTGLNADSPSHDTIFSFTVATGAAPPYPADVHLTFGNPSGAVTDLLTPNNYLMSKPEFALSYNRDRGTPNWVSWHLTDEWIGSLARVDTFRPDPEVPAVWYRVLHTDYFNSGFDRGHMTPNADRDPETSIPINQATFLMSNMVPQAPDNNQGPWAAMESYLRTLLPANELYIVSGPAGVGGTGSSGFMTSFADGHVTVPAATWKVALVLPKSSGDDVARVTGATRTIAVIMPNVQGIRNDDWTSYLTTVNAVEMLTGYDFFANVADATENAIEAGVNGVNPPGVANQTANVDEDTPGTITLEAVSAGAGTLTYTIVSTPAHGTLSGTGANQTYTPAPDYSGTDSFTFNVSDGSRTSNTATVAITVYPVNDAPVATLTAPSTGVEGSGVTASVFVSDVDSATGTIAWSVTKNGSPYANGTGASVGFTPDDDGTYVVSVTATDGGGATGSDSKSISVSNIEPVISATTGPVTQLAVGTPATVSVTYSDAGAADTHTATFTWGDGSTSNVSCGAGTCTASRIYAAAGVYSVSVVVSDDDGGTATSTFTGVVVYDNAAGFVTGGGWLATSSGKATLAINAKYLKNAAIPTGNTRFDVASSTFASTSYDWLVIAGTTAQLQGTGTIDSVGSYGFLAVATDAGATDTFRLRVWDKTTGATVYDSGAAAPLGGGNISIHQ
jgi:endonuclease G